MKAVTFRTVVAKDKNKNDYIYLAIVFREREVGRIYLSNEQQTIVRELEELSVELDSIVANQGVKK